MRGDRRVLLRPLVTEKATGLQDRRNQYTFEVDRQANKLEIREAVQRMFNVKVEKVRTLLAHGKIKRMGRFRGHRPDWKKAIVTLEEGESIDLFGGA